jgi:hypothetical protein
MTFRANMHLTRSNEPTVEDLDLYEDCASILLAQRNVAARTSPGLRESIRDAHIHALRRSSVVGRPCDAIPRLDNGRDCP